MIDIEISRLLWHNILLFGVSCFFLIVLAEVLVKSLTKIATYFHMTDFVVGFIVVALATSIPELFIGVTSAFEGQPELSLGNVLGSNIIDLTLVIGILAILKRGIRVETKALQTDTLYMFFISVLPLVVMLDRSIDKFDGFILLAAFFLYVVRLFAQRSRFHEETHARVSHKEFAKSVFSTAVSIVLLLVIADLLVRSATNISSDLLSEQLNLIILGLFLISIGTTLPELIFGSGAVMMKHKYMAFGDVIGSVVANNTLVLGVVALASQNPITPNFLIFLISAFFMIVVAFLFTTLVEVEKHILWQEGVVMILLYLLFVLVVLNIRLMEVNYGMG